MTIHSYVESVGGTYPDLFERLAPEPSAGSGKLQESNGSRPIQRKGAERVYLFEEHKPMSEVTDGIRQGRLVET